MSSVAISGNASGTAVFTIASPATSTNRTLTIPDVTDTLAGIAATQTLTNKTLTSPTLTTPNIDSAQVATVSGTAPLYLCRAWVNFNGTGTVAIRASGNVSSITDNGVGDYTANITTALQDTNFSVCGLSSADASVYTDFGQMNMEMRATSSYTTSSCRVIIKSTRAGGASDGTFMNISIFR